MQKDFDSKCQLYWTKEPVITNTLLNCLFLENVKPELLFWELSHISSCIWPYSAKYEEPVSSKYNKLLIKQRSTW